jgi:phosphoribosylaminoimidazole-succinocarboxamide synthase
MMKNMERRKLMTKEWGKPDYAGKVRDIYDLGDELLLIASDRISAFDYILKDEIPFKGEVLNRMSLFWFDYFSDVIENHVISADVKDLPAEFAEHAQELAGRFVIVRKLEMLPLECIVRGYLAGSRLKEYLNTGAVFGFNLPDGLQEGSKLPYALYTPTTKAAIGEHDEDIAFDKTIGLVGADLAKRAREVSLRLYEAARERCEKAGILLADTKLEFGLASNKLVLADEAFTPDSSRFWPADTYAPGKAQPSFDKQFVRDWLNANWDKTGEVPQLPKEVIEKTSEIYIRAYEEITGAPFVSAANSL